MKKLLAVVLTLIMVLSLTACGANMEGTYKLTEYPTEENIFETNKSHIMSFGQIIR